MGEGVTTLTLSKLFDACQPCSKVVQTRSFSWKLPGGLDLTAFLKRTSSPAKNAFTRPMTCFCQRWHINIARRVPCSSRTRPIWISRTLWKFLGNAYESLDRNSYLWISPLGGAIRTTTPAPRFEWGYPGVIPYEGPDLQTGNYWVSGAMYGYLATLSFNVLMMFASTAHAKMPYNS